MSEPEVECDALGRIWEIAYQVRHGAEAMPDGLFAEREGYDPNRPPEVVGRCAAPQDPSAGRLGYEMRALLEGEGAMRYDPERHHRRSIRLRGYDYSQAGAYFITICTQNRECLLGQVVNGEMRLNHAGCIVERALQDLPNHVANVILDAFVVMPNHVHAIIIINRSVGAGSEPAPTGRIATAHGLPEIVRQLKTFSARRINAMRRTPGVPVWQRNYYEHIIRSEESLHRIRQYIADNPLRWAFDRENPAAEAPEPETAWLT